MKKLYVFLILILTAGVMFAAKTTTFTNLARPYHIELDDSQLYVADGPSVSIYSLKDYKMVKQFGRQGEGPEEFITGGLSGRAVLISLEPDSIRVISKGKISSYQKDGTYQWERPTSPNITGYSVGKHFTGVGYVVEDNSNYSTLVLYDFQFKKLKELYRRKSFLQNTGSLNPFFAIRLEANVYKENIYLATAEGKILVLDKNGKKKFDITLDLKKLSVGKTYEAEFRKSYEMNPSTKEFYNSVKNRIKFPEYFPTIRRIKVADDKIYVLTYNRKGVQSEFLIYDIKGKFIKKTMVPFVNRNVAMWSPYAIKNGKLYQLVENDDSLDWELHITNIK